MENIDALRKYLHSHSIPGMVTALDEAVGNITKSLKNAGIFDDTIIIFTADVTSLLYPVPYELTWLSLSLEWWSNNGRW